MSRVLCLRHTFLLLIFLLISLVNYAQQSNTLYLLHSVPQSNQLNPAVQIPCKLFIGIPVLSTIHANVSNSSFTFNDFGTEDQLNLDGIYRQLHPSNMLSAELFAYPISIGYRYKKHYFTFSISENVNLFASFPRRILELALYGNADFIGRTAKLNNTRLNSFYTRSFRAGWSYKWDQYTSFGIRGNLNFGKANIHTGRSQIGLSTDAETYALSLLGDVSANISFPLTFTPNSSGQISDFDFGDPDYLALLFNRSNIGASIDLGIIHEYSDEITLSASILDLGVQSWRSDVNNVQANVDVSFEGISGTLDLTSSSNYSILLDSILDEFMPTLSQDSYLTLLPAQIFLGASYAWRKNISFGIVNRNLFVNRWIHSSISASATGTILNNFHGTISWSYLNNTLWNAGAALAYSGRGMQFYAVSDNVLGFIRPADTRTLNFRFGMNLMLGCPKKNSRSVSESHSMVPCPPGQLKREKKRRR